MNFNRYQVPPNFEICRLHIEAARPFYAAGEALERCPCCERKICHSHTPLCASTNTLLRISEQIPLYFAYIKAIVFVLLLFAAALVLQYFTSTTLHKVQFALQLPTEDIYIVKLGYFETERWVRFSYFLLFTVLVLLVRGYLKKSKYQVQSLSNTLSDRSIMLTNVHHQATVRDIRDRFQQFDLEKVVFTYRVRDYHKCLIEIYRIQKERIIAKKDGESPIRKQLIEQKLSAKLIEAQNIFRTFRVPENQLDIVFITFRSSAKRDVFLVKHQTGIFGRLFYKFCSCCSGTAINGQHTTVRKAPAPEDIAWLNFEYDYWTKKMHRVACYYMCFAILVYGIMFQYEVSIMKSTNFVTSILRTFVVFVANFIIITLLEYTTNEVEKHELNTNKLLSLVRKLTFFIFLNLSMSPLSIFLYFQFSNDENPDPRVTAFDTLCFSVLTICIGNIFKPLAEYFNVQRIVRFISYHYHKYKQLDCELTQQEAHFAFEPIPFPLAGFYSLLISSILMTAFFLSCFQVLVLVELLACVILYWTSKYMLLKVCKEPSGMKNHVGRLCQRILTNSIYVYWLGDKVMYYCIIDKDRTVADYIGDMGAFEIIELVLLTLIFFFSSTLLAKLSLILARDDEIGPSLLMDDHRNVNSVNSYEDVNAIILLEEEYRKILKAV